MADLGLMDRINADLLARATLFTKSIPEDFFPGDFEEEIICRHDPGPVITDRDLTGSSWQAFAFSYYVRSKDVIKARQTLEAIAAALVDDQAGGRFGLTEGRLTQVTRPTPVSKDEGGVTIYTSSFKLDFFQEG